MVLYSWVFVHDYCTVMQQRFNVTVVVHRLRFREDTPLFSRADFLDKPWAGARLRIQA